MNAITEQAIEVMEEFRTNMRNRGALTPGVEAFVDEMNVLIVLCDSPKDALDVLFRALAVKRDKAAGVQA